MSMPGPMELVLIFLVILLLVGGRKLPEIARGLGESVREFKKSFKEVEQDLKDVRKIT